MGGLGQDTRVAGRLTCSKYFERQPANSRVPCKTNLQSLRPRPLPASVISLKWVLATKTQLTPFEWSRRQLKKHRNMKWKRNRKRNRKRKRKREWSEGKRLKTEMVGHWVGWFDGRIGLPGLPGWPKAASIFHLKPHWYSITRSALDSETPSPLATWTKQTADADAELRKTEALCNGNETSIKVAHRAAPRQRIRRRSILRAWENGCPTALAALVSWQPVSLLLSLLLPEHIALVLGNLETLLWRAAGTLVRLPQGLRAYFVSFYCLIVISHMGNGKFNWLRWSISLPAPQRRFIRKGVAGEGPQWQSNWAEETQRFCFFYFEVEGYLRNFDNLK